jgi:hypothetical protein
VRFFGCGAFFARAALAVDFFEVLFPGSDLNLKVLQCGV